MFDIVAPDQHQAPTAVHRGGVDHGQSRHPPALGIGADAIVGETANQPCGHADQRQNGDECEEECQCLHSLVPGHGPFSHAGFDECGLVFLFGQVPSGMRFPPVRTMLRSDPHTANHARDQPYFLIPRGERRRPVN